MKTQRAIRRVTRGPNGLQVKLLLVGPDDEFKGNVAGRVFDGSRSWITGRSATLLGALERLHTQAIDIVLVSHRFPR